jgi:hypothetical protein
VGVAAGETDVSGLREFVARNHMEYPVAYLAEGTAAGGWQARPNGIPLVFIVDRTGHIAWWGEPRGEAFAQAVARALAT